MRTKAYLILLLALSSTTYAQNYWQQAVDYIMDVDMAFYPLEKQNDHLIRLQAVRFLPDGRQTLLAKAMAYGITPRLSFGVRRQAVNKSSYAGSNLATISYA